MFISASREGRAVVRLPAGALTEEAVEAAARLVEGAGRRDAVLDLGCVGRPTAGGLGRLVALHTRLRAAGGGLALCNVGPPVYEALAATRLTEVLAVGPPG
jgi:anti-anti-sigma regulatory factor